MTLVGMCEGTRKSSLRLIDTCGTKRGMWEFSEDHNCGLYRLYRDDLETSLMVSEKRINSVILEKKVLSIICWEKDVV